MAGRIGRKVTLTWDGNEVPGVREKGVSCNGAPINVTSDEDDGWQTLLDEAGENSVSISLSGVTKSDVLLAAWASGERTQDVVIGYPGGATLEGSFYLATLTPGEPYNDAATFQAELQSTGEVTYTPAAAPVNSVLPAISGVAQVGQTLTALVGVFSGSPTSYTYQWQEDDSGWANISGATAKTYVPIVGEVGNPLRVIVTAINGAGSTPATSAATADVIAA